MAKTDKPNWNGCPVRYAAGIFGDKWCFILLRDTLLRGKRSYSEFLDAGEGISTNILASRLVRLEEAGMLIRKIDPRKGSRVCYFPTQKARALLPAFLGMVVWAIEFDEETEAPDGFAAGFLENPTGTVARISAQIDQINRDILGDAADAL